MSSTQDIINRLKKRSEAEKQKKTKDNGDLKTESLGGNLPKSKDGLTIYPSFNKMNLNKELLKGIYSIGYEKPSLVQSKAIVPIISGKDIIIQQQSGTGKTATFTIAMLQVLYGLSTFNKKKSEGLQALVISPTRELAIQINGVIENLGTYLKVDSFCLTGLTNNKTASAKASTEKKIKLDLKALESADIVSGTPGKIVDCLKRNQISLDNLKMIILDEADELLDEHLGFKKQIYEIFSKINIKTQVLILSATMSTNILEVSKKIMNWDNHIKILTKKKEISLDVIKQYKIDLKENWKVNTLSDILNTVSYQQAVIFVNNVKKCDSLYKFLNKQKFSIVSIHSKLSQLERIEQMNKFRNGTYKILVTTDIWARGIDVQQINLVVNYDLPTIIENYIHRIGRSGRFGRLGNAINFVTDEDANQLSKIEKYYKIEIPDMPSGI
ncbi:hypothetical protein QEN19_000999 [Hanseniaspora menglaensis]